MKNSLNHRSNNLQSNPARRSARHKIVILADSDFAGFCLAFALIFWESALRLKNGTYWDLGLLLILLFSFSAALLLTALEQLSTGIKAKAAAGVLMLVFSLIYCSQLIYYNIFATYYSFFSFQNGGQVLEFFEIIVAEVVSAGGWILLMLLPVIIYFVLLSKALRRRKLKSKHQHSAHRPKKKNLAKMLICFWVSAALFVTAVIIINLGSKVPNTAYHSYYVDRYPNYSVQNLGLFTTTRRDIILSLFPDLQHAPPAIDVTNPGGSETSPSTNESSTTYPTVETSQARPDLSPGPGDPTGPEPTVTEPSVSEPAVLSIDFANLISNEQNSEIRQMHEWFSRRTPSMTNEYTGRFADYNLIMLTAEGFSHLAIDPELTPTLYKMSTEGFVFENFYTPGWGVSTSDGEYVATTGLIPKSGVWSMYKSSRNSMPFTMGNQLRQLGYLTMAYHNHTYDYYRRDLSHPNLGYTYKGLGNGLDVTPTWPESDLEMMELSVDEFINNEPFHAYYMTVSGHLQYNFNGNFIARKNQSLVDHLPYPSSVQAYLATQIELDLALEYLMSRLEQADIADKTLFVLSADHYPYGLAKSDIELLAGNEVDSNFELYRNGLIIYAQGMDSEIVEKPVSSLDIMPTVSNLLGLDFDSRLFMGSDVFSDVSPLVIFLNRSFITDQGRYNAATRSWLPNAGSTADEAYVSNILNDIEQRFYYSAKILENDYYSLLDINP